MTPPTPFAEFHPHTAACGFAFSFSSTFGHLGNAFIAELGSEAPVTTGGKPGPNVGHRVSRLDMKTGQLTSFAHNRNGTLPSTGKSGGLERPVMVSFGPHQDLYIVDMGILRPSEGFEKNTGVIWRIVRG